MTSRRCRRLREATAAEQFEYYLESYLELYRNHKDMLRFNQFFNVYVVQEAVPPEMMKPYTESVQSFALRFHGIYQQIYCRMEEL